jgi:DsbC/DsbD-like thiol-disulfide interchange protein
MRHLTLALAVACLGTVLLAQGRAPLLPIPERPKHLVVATSASAAAVKAGSQVVLAVDVQPNPGIRVYAPGAKGYTPIALTIRPSSGVVVGETQYPKSEVFFFEPLAERVAVYQKPFRLTRTLTIAKTSKPNARVMVSGTLDYQACDDRICFVPESVPVSWTVVTGN